MTTRSGGFGRGDLEDERPGLLRLDDEETLLTLDRRHPITIDGAPEHVRSVFVERGMDFGVHVQSSRDKGRSFVGSKLNVSPLGAIGNTPVCATSTTITDMTIQMDDNANWYVLSGTPSGSQYDLRSVTIHEFGHANGFFGPNNGHFLASDSVCTTSPIHTMCSGISPGTTYKRTLESHETSLLTAGY